LKLQHQRLNERKHKEKPKRFILTFLLLVSRRKFCGHAALAFASHQHQHQRKLLQNHIANYVKFKALHFRLDCLKIVSIYSCSNAHGSQLELQ